MRGIDFTSWQSLLSTLLALALVTLIGVGIRLVAMSTIQQRRERANRQINERLRVLISAYKTLGGSFTGDLSVDPTHLRDLRKRAAATPEGEGIAAEDLEGGSDRSRRMRDAVEGALSDIILLGTEQQVKLAGHAARELVAGRHVHTHELVVSLRDFIRKALDLEPVPADLEIPMQGPSRPGGASGGGGKGKGGGEGERAGNGGGNRAGGQGGAAMGMGVGGMAGFGLGAGTGEPEPEEHSPEKGG